MFIVGDKIICVDASMSSDISELVNNSKQPVNWVKEGEIYTIRFIRNNDDIVVGILLNEIVNPYFYIPLLGRSEELAFAMFRFRKLTEEELKQEIKEETEICI